ncbi:hypothetical protein HPB52_006266 [Rhipicephalus sanguineus]|uniref:DUF7041 domain-containing protein n=1 Tax=Rhipicephalus sanguineus TaxID=34632 RepID=A0A9D4QIN5_RHISA|nr:hypothetical protein HPB52_006266 [Rhipicephalus sanguineus]
MDEAMNDRPTITVEGIAMVQIHLPSLWPENPAAWFTHAEAIYDLRHITWQRAKFFHAVSALTTEVVQELPDVDVPHDTTHMTTLKRRCCTTSLVSVRRRLRQFLNEEELGERTTLEFLRRMRRLLNRQSRLEQVIDDHAVTITALRSPPHPRRRDRDCPSRGFLLGLAPVLVLGDAHTGGITATSVPVHVNVVPLAAGREICRRATDGGR